MEPKEIIRYIGEPVYAKAKVREAINQIRKEFVTDNMLDPNYNHNIRVHCDFLERIIEQYIPEPNFVQFSISVPQELFSTEEQCIRWNQVMQEFTQAAGLEFTRWQVTLDKTKEKL